MLNEDCKMIEDGIGENPDDLGYDNAFLDKILMMT